jgi:DNA-binding response OmpR family regulator
MNQTPDRHSNSTHASAHSPVRVILVEDDFDLRQGLTDFLRLNSLSVTAVANGAEFDRALGTENFDVAVIDLNLPDTNGFDIAGRLSKIGIGIVILTARTLRDDRLRGYGAGADIYLTKPVDGDELVLAVKNLARRIQQIGKASQEPLRTTTSWFVDRIAQVLISPQGIAIKLSGREAKFLLRLAAEGGNTVSRAELLSAMGYQASAELSRGLDAVLRRLRSKARNTGVDLPVHAVHAAGFHFAGRITTN